MDYHLTLNLIILLFPWHQSKCFVNYHAILPVSALVKSLTTCAAWAIKLVNQSKTTTISLSLPLCHNLIIHHQCHIFLVWTPQLHKIAYACYLMKTTLLKHVFQKCITKINSNFFPKVLCICPVLYYRSHSLHSLSAIFLWYFSVFNFSAVWLS